MQDLLQVILKKYSINSSVNEFSFYLCLDIIQEIRAAHKLMEQTLESKLNSFSANKNEIPVNNVYE